MRRARAAAGTLLFLVVAPRVVAGLVPWLLTGWAVHEWWPPLRVLGGLTILAGLAVLLEAFARFVVEGIGTPAPIAPPERLVVGGAYRYVRNPMYLAVAGLIVGQALMLGQLGLLLYAAAFGVTVAAFVHGWEEPALSRRFGAQVRGLPKGRAGVAAATDALERRSGRGPLRHGQHRSSRSAPSYAPGHVSRRARRLMSAATRTVRRSRPATVAPAVVLLAGALLGAGCGRERPEPPRPAASPGQFVSRFAELSGVRLERAGDPFGIRLDVPEVPDRFARFGTYSLVWTKDDSSRDVVLGRRTRPDARGIYWRRSGSDGWSASKPYGPRLALSWTGEATRRTTAKWDRLERAVRAAYLGRPQLLPPKEQPCRRRNLDPLGPRPGSCAVEGVPVSFAGGSPSLSTPTLETRVLGSAGAASVGPPGLSPKRARGRFVIVAVRVRNVGARPVRFLNLQLRLGGRTVREDAGAGVALPQSRSFPLPPGATLEQRVAFDIDPALAARARAEGALVVPAALDELRNPAPDVAQGWIRLASAPAKLPPPPRPAGGDRLARPPRPAGVPRIRFIRGSGPPVGGTARRVFTAGTYFPIPRNFVAGGVPAGSRAGSCRVPVPSRADKAALLAAVRAETGRAGVPFPRNDQVLLANCAGGRRWAMFTWTVRGPRGPVVSLDEFARRGGRWIGSPPRSPPGCRLPLAAVAAWQIDVSICKRRRR